MNLTLSLIYRLIVAPLATVLLPLAALLNKKVRAGLYLRRQPSPQFDFQQPPVWIHAASGEFEYAKSVIRELKDRHPTVPILVTYFSPTYRRVLETFPGVDLAVPLPLDLPGPCNSFLRKYKPRILLIARTDLWPEMLYQCRRKKIPVYLFSCTQRALSPLAFFQRAYRRWLLGYIDRIDCVTKEDYQNVLSIYPKAKVEVSGDTRYDQVDFRLRHPKPLPGALKPTRPTVIAGSTWPEDEAEIIPGLASYLRTKQIKLILVPHEPTVEHIRALKDQLTHHQLTFALFSEQRAWDDKEVLIVDRVGILAEIYPWGAFAFVGGSFRKTVHSVMEALGAGCVTFVGPKHLNNREAVDFAHLKFVQVMQKGAKFENLIQPFLENPDQRQFFARSLRAEFQRRLGASAKLMAQLKPVVAPQARGLEPGDPLHY